MVMLEQQGATEVAMPVDLLHTFPLTHEHAVGVLLEAPWSPSEVRWIEERSLTTLYHPLGDPIKKNWHLGERSFPLPRHYMKRFQLGDSGDMTALILLNWLAVRHGETFNLEGYVLSFQQQWLNKGIDPVTLQKKV